MKRFLLSLAVLLALATASAAAPQGWSGFRNGGNASVEGDNYPTVWTPSRNIAWKAALPGYGQSAPAVWKDRVFVTGVPGRQRTRNLVVCLDAKTGKELWKQEFPVAAAVELHDMVSRAAPTPIVEEGALYVFFESGDLLRLAPADGRVTWQRSLFQEYGEFKNNHGLGCSPAQTRNSLVLQIDHQGPSYLIAIDKATGKTHWKTERPSRSSWTSPIVTRQGSREVVIVSSSGDVQGYDAETGAALWKFEGVTGNHIPSPTTDGERVYIGATQPRGVRGAAGARTPAQSNLALRLTQEDGKPGVELAWEGRGAVCDYGSPTLHRGLLYLVNPVGVAYCIDPRSGEVKYSERIDGACWTPPLGVGEYLYFFGKNGVTTVIKAGPRFEKLGSNRLWERESPPLPGEDYTPPRRAEGSRAEGGQPVPGGGAPAGPLDPCVFGVAAANGDFYARVGTHLFCIRIGP